MQVLESIKSKLNLKDIKLSASIIILILISTFMIGILICQSHKTINDSLTTSAQNQKTTLAVLNKIDGRINQLSLQINKVDTINSNPQIAAINAHLNTIEQYLNRLNPQGDLQQLQTSLNHADDEILRKIVTMQRQIQHLKQQLTPQSYLSISALPFQVTSIDIWNGTPQATIQLGDETALMAQGDIRSGWTLTAISFSPSYVIFKNARDQSVKAELP